MDILEIEAIMELKSPMHICVLHVHYRFKYLTFDNSISEEKLPLTSDDILRVKTLNTSSNSK